MTINKFRGTGVALVTPFKKNGRVDYNALSKIVDFQIENGVNYLVVMGTTAEVATLSDDEKLSVINHIIEVNAKRVPLVVGFGGNCTQTIVQQIEDFSEFDEIDAILSVAPYYNKPNQKGLFLHYKAIANVSPVPVILYNVPGRTGVNINAETCLKLASKIENIIGIKEASGNMEQIMSILKDKPNDFLVISGDDSITYPLISLGACGVISVLGNAFPKEWSSMVKLALEGKNEEALAIHYKLFDVIKNIFTEGNPAGIKAILNSKNLCENHLRLPLTPISDLHHQKLSEIVDNL
ncbi:4-hydroxy-tetrahydrodipicolinate synthase [Labilibaculum filiforme]|uniref:4-hydroxy-tetrahydrodipicolinate synthase n=1 Tax=Labilibaculum filiforme TaxID=1940526 RepID=A0A2N3I0Q1_9BACT|nr:4-hydroxy-tetrahydrodipicolinate synthase [Labilibaculum filiforme]PKQ63881.1 4-hydroxy-tetrahydrodipicolinate synthase [Labilibaculum filiforme]